MTHRIATLIISFVLVLPSSAQVTCAIRTAHANARKSASSAGKIIAYLNHGDLLQIISDVQYWYEVTLQDGRQAYVSKATCTVVPEKDPGEEDSSAVQDFYTSPGPTAPMTPPSCAPTVLPVDWTVCPATGSGGIHAKAYVEKNRVAISCSYEPTNVDQILQLDHLPANVRALPTTDKRVSYLQAIEGKTVVVDGYLAMVKDGGKEGVNCGSTTRLDIHMELVDTDGYMFFDDAHAKDGSVGTWRGTEWEVHPITRIEVMENGGWKTLE
jgi:hypothetical protein